VGNAIDPARVWTCERWLFDSSVVRNFTKAGFGSVLVRVFVGRAAITVEVAGELDRHAATEPNLFRLLEQWPEGDPLQLPSDLLMEAADIVEILRPVGGHELENTGEVSTVLIAERLISEGQPDTVVFLDDGEGKRLCDRRGVPYIDTQALVVELCVSEQLSEKDAKRIWRASFSDPQKWAGFEARLARRRQESGG
jgi:hypothetical protein